MFIGYIFLFNYNAFCISIYMEPVDCIYRDRIIELEVLEKDSFLPRAEGGVSRELLLHRDKLMPPLFCSYVDYHDGLSSRGVVMHYMRLYQGCHSSIFLL